MKASLNGHSEVVKLLHKYGAQINLQNNDGVTALMAASQNGHSEVVKLLQDYGARVDLHNNDRKTASEIAHLYGHSELVKVLQAADADTYTALTENENDRWESDFCTIA